MDLEITNTSQNNNSTSFSKELENYINKTNTYFSIDRFENNFAICENMQTHEMINIEKSLIPENCKSGDILAFKEGKYVLDKSQTLKKQNEIKNLVNSLLKKKK